MTRLLVHVEGETEETFVKELLGPHLLTQGYLRVDPRLMGNARVRDRRGGIKPWPSARRDILNHLREDRTCAATTMVDYYGMPQPAYQKPLLGNLAALQIGLPAMRAACPGFRRWLEHLERLEA